MLNTFEVSIFFSSNKIYIFSEFDFHFKRIFETKSRNKNYIKRISQTKCLGVSM